MSISIFQHTIISDINIIQSDIPNIFKTYGHLMELRHFSLQVSVSF